MDRQSREFSLNPFQRLPYLGGDAPGPVGVGVDIAPADQQPIGQLRVPHFQREEANRRTLPGGAGHEVQRGGTLAHTGTSGHNDQLPATPAARIGVKAPQAR